MISEFIFVNIVVLVISIMAGVANGFACGLAVWIVAAIFTNLMLLGCVVLKQLMD